MKNKRIFILITIVIVIATAVMASGGWKAIFYWEDSAGGLVVPQKHSQPIAYNHSLHISNDMECVDCHIYVETMQRATIPNIDVCSMCHDPEAPITDPLSPEEKKLIGYIEKDEKIPWVKIHVVPDFVYFSHQRHVTLGKLDCGSCHGDMAKMEKPVTAQKIKISMERCIDCHKESQAAHDCINCHR